MSEGYEGHGRTVGERPVGPHRSASVFEAATVFTSAAAGPGPDDTQIPFLGHTFRVSGLRDELHARRAAPDGWIRHA
ncbi:hypothetical protein AB0D57_11370 [Streptomyces sp. NPDC048275]|uniref:hypothetical protein n=1 Tax=Streptomyces sp. NPDC048275 TaxID=3155629 RepID=UPI0033E8D4B8